MDFEVVASHFGGKRLNSPNDLVFDRNGHLWFTDPAYGWDYLPKYANEMKKADRCEGKCTPYRGVYRIKNGDKPTETDMMADL